MRNLLIRWDGRDWGHQQAQGLMRSIGEGGVLKVSCHFGNWHAGVCCGGRKSSGRGRTLWLALADALNGNEETDRTRET